MKFKEWIPILKEWAKMDEHLKRVEESERLIKEAMRRNQKPYIAYSGGKDSSVMLHLVLKQKPDIMVLHWDYGRYYIPRWLEDEFIQNAKEMGVKYLRLETSEQYEKLKRNAVNVLGSEYIGKLIPQLKKEGYDVAFVGLRKEESLKRRRRIKRCESIGGIEECWPVQNWSWKDVWAYIFAYDLPHASIYEKYANVLGIDKVRLVTFFDKEFDKLGSTNIDGLLMWRERYNKEV